MTVLIATVHDEMIAKPVISSCAEALSSLTTWESCFYRCSILLQNLLTKDFVQEDRVWQSEPRQGRESIKNGIQFIRRWYPDAR